jgi:predicted nucleic acid-binding protein
MNAVVDTNVVAYYLLATEPFVEEVRSFWHRVDVAMAPASWEAELANVLWMAVRANVIEPDDAVERLALAEQLGIESRTCRDLWQGAVGRACVSGVAAYDTLFVELAVREELPLVTFDQGVLRAFPKVAKRPKLLARRRTR